MKTSQSPLKQYERLYDKPLATEQVAGTKHEHTKHPGKTTAARYSKDLIISVNETRKLLGQDANMTDDSLAEHIFALTELAQELLSTSNLPQRRP